MELAGGLKSISPSDPLKDAWDDISRSSLALAGKLRVSVAVPIGTPRTQAKKFSIGGAFGMFD